MQLVLVRATASHARSDAHPYARTLKMKKAKDGFECELNASLQVALGATAKCAALHSASAGVRKQSYERNQYSGSCLWGRLASPSAGGAEAVTMTSHALVRPSLPASRLKDTWSPSVRLLKPLLLMAEWWTKISSLPSSGVMNPNLEDGVQRQQLAVSTRGAEAAAAAAAAAGLA
jgi:hypothetical protein